MNGASVGIDWRFIVRALRTIGRVVRQVRKPQPGVRGHRWIASGPTWAQGKEPELLRG